MGGALRPSICSELLNGPGRAVGLCSPRTPQSGREIQNLRTRLWGAHGSDGETGTASRQLGRVKVRTQAHCLPEQDESFVLHLMPPPPYGPLESSKAKFTCSFAVWRLPGALHYSKRPFPSWKMGKTRLWICVFGAALWWPFGEMPFLLISPRRALLQTLYIH